MSEKIVQLNEEMIKGQIRELVRGKRGGNPERAAGEGGGVADASSPL